MRTLELEIVNENVFILSKDKTVESLGYGITVKKGFDFDGASIPNAMVDDYGRFILDSLGRNIIAQEL